MVSGVAQVSVFGAAKYAVRVDVDPRKLPAHGIGIDEVADRDRRTRTSTCRPARCTAPSRPSRSWPTASCCAPTAYGPTIIAYRNGNPVRLDEVAHVYDGVENDKIAALVSTASATIYLAIQKQPGTNVVAVVDAVKQLLPTFREQLPAAVVARRPHRPRRCRSASRCTTSSSRCCSTVGLVVLVIFLFLRNVSATIIPSLALPASIVATFAVMYLLDYSLDNLSLMALTLSVGFVVDDAIVMLENIVRHMEMGKPPMRAAFDGSKEIAFTILSMTLSLAAVFIPVLFMGGVVGRLLHEFAVTIGVAILVSGFVSISLTPMLCSRFLKPPHAQKHGAFYNATERMFDAWLRLYDWTLRVRLRFRAVTMAVSIALLVGTGLPVHARARRASCRARIRAASTSAPKAIQGIGFDEMVRHQQRGRRRSSRKDPDIAGFSSNVGGGPAAAAALNTGPHQRRPEAARRAQRGRSIRSSPSCGRSWRRCPASASSWSTSRRSTSAASRARAACISSRCRTPTPTELYDWAPILEAKMRELPGIEDVSSDLQLKNPQIQVDMDRDKISALGLTVNQVETALYNAYGTRQVSQIYAPNNQYQVILQVAPEFQKDPGGAVDALRRARPAARLIPLDTVATVTHRRRAARPSATPASCRR